MFFVPLLSKQQLVPVAISLSVYFFGVVAFPGIFGVDASDLRVFLLSLLSSSPNQSISHVCAPLHGLLLVPATPKTQARC